MNTNFAPLRIEFKMAGPIQMDYLPIHLDGLLAWAYLQEQQYLFTKGERDLPPCPQDPDDPMYSDLPIKSEGGVYCASVLLAPSTQGVSTRFFTRKSDTTLLADLGLEELNTGRGVIPNQSNSMVMDTTRGELKAHFGREQLRHVQSLVAYAIGDKAAIEQLLSDHVHSLGKNRAKGFGRVASINVEIDPSAEENWRVRAMPEKRPGYIPIPAPIRPPYWNKSLVQIAYFPSEIL